MATVRHACGGCGGPVDLKDARCKACGNVLDWNDARPEPSRSSSAKHAKRKGDAGESRKGAEPWQVISFVAVGALLAFLAWTEISRDRATPAPVAVQSPVQMPALGAGSDVDLGRLEAAVAADPKDGGARLQLANGLHDHGMLPQAIEHYKAYLGVHPENPDARVDLGICYDQLGLIDSTKPAMYFALAIREMETVAMRDPSHQAAAFNLGIVNLHRGDFEEFNRWMKKAVEIDKNSELGMRAQRMLQQHSFTP